MFRVCPGYPTKYQEKNDRRRRRRRRRKK